MNDCPWPDKVWYAVIAYPNSKDRDCQIGAYNFDENKLYDRKTIIEAREKNLKLWWGFLSWNKLSAKVVVKNLKYKYPCDFEIQPVYGYEIMGNKRIMEAFYDAKN